MANTIILKRSATPGKVPTTAQLALGEIAINTYDGLIYIKKDDGTQSIAQIGGVTSVNGETGSITIDTGDVAENGNQYFTQTRARASLSGTGAISYNSSTGAITTTQNLTTAGSPTFAGLTLTGGIPSIAGDILPSADVTYDLGSPTKQWKDIYVGPGSLYVNGSKVLEDQSGTITFTADLDQSLQLKTTGVGNIGFVTGVGGVISVGSTLQIGSGKNITDSAGVEVNFGDNIDMNNNKIVGLGAPSSANDATTKTYVDTAIAAISTSSITQGNSNVTVTDTGTGTVTVTVDGSTALTVDATGVVVAGNFTVSGTTTSVNSNTISLADNIITLNSDATGAATQNAGIEVERGDDTNTQIRWNEGTDTWTFTNDGAVYYPLATSTDVLAEGSTNLYHTTSRARGVLSASSATGVSYNSTTGAISLGSIPNSSLSNNSITINGTAVSLGGTRTLDTDSLAEGTNQYFTNARARAALSAGTGISYNSTTGAISTSAIPNASLSNSAVTVGTTSISLGASSTTLAGLTSVSSTSFTGALTGNADTATSAGKWTTARTITLAGDLSGSVSIDGSANVTLTATVAGDTVALGTDTTGNYVASVSAGTGISISGSGEGAAITVSLDTATSIDKTTAQTLTNKSLSDSTTFIIDDADATKKLTFSVGGITTGTTRTLTAPDVSGTIITTGDTGTVTNTMLAGSIATSKITGLATSATTDTTNAANITSGTLPNARLSAVPNSALANSAITINGSSTALGGSINVGTVTSVAAGSYLTGGTITGTGTLAVDATTTNTASKIVARDASGNFSAGTITATFSGNLTGNVTGNVTGSAGTVTSISGNTLTSGQITTGLGFTPYNSTNPSGYISSYTETDTLSSVTGRGASTGTAITISNATASSSKTTGALIVTGGVGVSGAMFVGGEITAYASDAALKTNVEVIGNALEKVEAIRGVSYDWNKDGLALGLTDAKQIGVIAQEVEAVIPELVCDSAHEGYKTVKYDKLTALLIEAVKELSAKVKTLEAQLGGKPGL